MIVRAKTKRRLLLLGVVTLLMGAAVAAFIVLRERGLRREYAAIRAEGVRAFMAKEWSTARDKLARYIGRYGSDAEAVLMFAQAAKRVPAPDGRQHLLLAKSYFERYLRLRPQHKEVWRELIDLYTVLSYNTEALEAVEPLLAQDPADVVLLRARARALFNLRRSREALEACEKCAKLQPADLEVHWMMLRLLRDLNRQSEIIPRAEKYLADNPDSGYAEILMSVAYDLVTDRFTAEDRKRAWDLARKADPEMTLLRRGDQEVSADTFSPLAASRFWARRAAQRSTSDPTYMRLVMSQLDRFGLLAESTAVLEKSDATLADPMLRHALVRRLWETGRWSEVCNYLRDLQPASASPADLELAALKAMSLAQLKRTAEAEQIVAHLEKAAENARLARAWAGIVRAMFLGQNFEPMALIDSIRGGLEVHRGSAYLRFFLGESYAALGETDLAIEAFREASAYAPTWFLPLLRVAPLLLENREPRLAADAAARAAALMPTVSVLAMATAIRAAADRDSFLADAEMARIVAEIQRANPGEENTLPLHVLILARSGQRKAAEEAVLSAVKATTRPSQSCLLKLAAASREAQLGLEQLCYDALEKNYGLGPETAYARAMELHGAGQTAESIAFFQDAWRRKGNPGDLNWRLAWATLLDQVKDERAAKEWVALGDDPAHKSNLTVQRRALAARAVQSDAAFIARTTERLRAITGEHSTTWKLARARALLKTGQEDADCTQAIELLRDVIKTVPNDLEPVVMLAVALERSGNVAGAIEQLNAAVRAHPEAWWVRVDLAKLYQAQMDYQKAGEMLEALPVDRLAPAYRAQVAKLLAAQGQISRAVAVMETISPPPTDSASLLVMAELHRARGRYDDAERIYAQLLKSPDAQIIASAAEFYAMAGRSGEAAKVLAMMDSLSIPAATRHYILAAHNARFGVLDEALRHYEAAAGLEPRGINIWTDWITHLTASGRIDDAIAVARRAAAANPKHKPFANFAGEAALLKALSDQRWLLPVAVSIVQIPVESDNAVEAVRLLGEAQANRQPVGAIIGRIRSLADKSPRLLSLQTVLVGAYRALGRMDDAAAVATRAMRAMPASAEAARLATRILADAGEWTQALAAAAHYRELTLANPLPADILIAEINIRLNNLAAAWKQIEPYIALSREKPAQYAGIVALQCRILIRNRQHEKAADILWPLLPQSPQWRQMWIDLTLGSLGDAAAAGAWLERITPLIPDNAVDEQIVLANAWYQWGVRADIPAYRERATAILDRLIARDDRSAAVHFARAVVDAQAGRREQAEAGYRRALELDKNLPLAQNNLAMLIAERGGNLDEAMELAARAIESRPEMATFHDTMAFVLRKRKDYKNAISSLLTAVRLEPTNLLWKINLATVYSEAGESTAALRVIEEIDAMAPDKSRLRPDLQKQIESLRSKLKGNLSAAG